MANDDCPCKGCVAPKRFPGCAATCPDWEVWHSAKVERDAKIRAIKDMEEVCFPPHLRKRGKKM